MQPTQAEFMTPRKSRQTRLAKACIEACCALGSTDSSRVDFTSYQHSAATTANEIILRPTMLLITATKRHDTTVACGD
jgi:hypothetical protein